MLSPSTIVVAAKDQVFCDLGGEAAILSLGSGIYYGLNAVGAFIWNQIQEPARVEDICIALSREYDVDHELCSIDVTRLLGELLEQKLIEVRDVAASTPS
jgi:hypothetical protein